MKNNTRLREFVRVSADGRVIPGTNIARKRRPNLGRWIEITNELCCTTSTTTSTTTTTIG